MSHAPLYQVKHLYVRENVRISYHCFQMVDPSRVEAALALPPFGNLIPQGTLRPVLGSHLTQTRLQRLKSLFEALQFGFQSTQIAVGISAHGFKVCSLIYHTL